MGIPVMEMTLGTWQCWWHNTAILPLWFGFTNYFSILAWFEPRTATQLTLKFDCRIAVKLSIAARTHNTFPSWIVTLVEAVIIWRLRLIILFYGLTLKPSAFHPTEPLWLWAWLQRSIDIKASIAQWICLYLPSCGHGFESRPSTTSTLCLFTFWYKIAHWILKITTNE